MWDVYLNNYTHKNLFLCSSPFHNYVDLFVIPLLFQETQNPAISVIADDETLLTFCERALTIYPGRIITIVVLGLEKYFRCVLMYSSSFGVI